MTAYAISAHGTFWGLVGASDEAAACIAAADEWGTEGNTEGLRAAPLTEAGAGEVRAWLDRGAHPPEKPTFL